ncbi:hypothetical protein [Emticicia soli]|uniref:DUF4595 domain-containing protein n=1 Tax=Emticicia soli TaxID=2027878 RepID=A0ABW5J4U8_9BACT
MTTKDTGLQNLTFRIAGKKIQMKYIIIFILIITFISCKKNEINEKTPVCKLTKATAEDSPADSIVYKYNENNKLSELINYGYNCGIKWFFTYPKPNQLVITYQPGCPDIFQDFFPVVIDFNATGQIIEMKKNPSNGLTFSPSYSGDNIVSLLRKSQEHTSETRFEYVGNNVSKAYRVLAGNTTVVDYEGLKYDNMKTLYTKEYIAFRLYTSTFIFDGMFDYLSQNNVLSYNRYLGSGPPVDKVERTIEYNSNQYPTKIISKISSRYVSYSTTGNYLYSCQ